MADGLRPFDLVDRIAQMEDRGLVSSSASAPTNTEAAGRARQDLVHRARGRGWDIELDTRRRLLLLEEMLRTQAGIHVRLPSHHAAPFRAIQFEHSATEVKLAAHATDVVTVDALDIASAAAATTLSTPLNIGGNTSVAQSHRAVITHVSVSILPAFEDPQSSELVWNTGTTWSLHKNRSSLFGKLEPHWCQQVHNDGSYTILPPNPGNLLSAPINLEQGDEVHITAQLPGVDDAVAGRRPIASWEGRVYTTVRGYIYPTRIDEPSIRGTVVD